MPPTVTFVSLHRQTCHASLAFRVNRSQDNKISESLNHHDITLALALDPTRQNFQLAACLSTGALPQFLPQTSPALLADGRLTGSILCLFLSPGDGHTVVLVSAALVHRSLIVAPLALLGDPHCRSPGDITRQFIQSDLDAALAAHDSITAVFPYEGRPGDAQELPRLGNDGKCRKCPLCGKEVSKANFAVHTCRPVDNAVVAAPVAATAAAAALAAADDDEGAGAAFAGHSEDDGDGEIAAQRCPYCDFQPNGRRKAARLVSHIVRQHAAKDSSRPRVEPANDTIGNACSKFLSDGRPCVLRPNGHNQIKILLNRGLTTCDMPKWRCKTHNECIVLSRRTKMLTVGSERLLCLARQTGTGVKCTAFFSDVVAKQIVTLFIVNGNTKNSRRYWRLLEGKTTSSSRKELSVLDIIVRLISSPLSQREVDRLSLPEKLVPFLRKEMNRFRRAGNADEDDDDVDGSTEDDDDDDGAEDHDGTSDDDGHDGSDSGDTDDDDEDSSAPDESSNGTATSSEGDDDDDEDNDELADEDWHDLANVLSQHPPVHLNVGSLLNDLAPACAADDPDGTAERAHLHLDTCFSTVKTMCGGKGRLYDAAVVNVVGTNGFWLMSRLVPAGEGLRQLVMAGYKLAAGTDEVKTVAVDTFRKFRFAVKATFGEKVVTLQDVFHVERPLQTLMPAKHPSTPQARQQLAKIFADIAHGKLSTKEQIDDAKAELFRLYELPVAAECSVAEQNAYLAKLLAGVPGVDAELPAGSIVPGVLAEGTAARKAIDAKLGDKLLIKAMALPPGAAPGAVTVSTTSITEATNAAANAHISKGKRSTMLVMAESALARAIYNIHRRLGNTARRGDANLLLAKQVGETIDKTPHDRLLFAMARPLKDPDSHPELEGLRFRCERAMGPAETEKLLAFVETRKTRGATSVGELARAAIDAGKVRGRRLDEVEKAIRNGLLATAPAVGAAAAAAAPAGAGGARRKRGRPQPQKTHIAPQRELRAESRQVVTGHAPLNKGDYAAVTVKDERGAPVTYVGEVCKKRHVDSAPLSLVVFLRNGEDVPSTSTLLPLNVRQSIFGVKRIPYFDTQ